MVEEREYQIVVGFDGSEGSQRALQWAADQARLRRGRLFVVRAWGHRDLDEKEEEIAQKALDEDVARFLGDDPGLAVGTAARYGDAAEVLLDDATSADMLVVGSRGHGEWRGLILGSVSQHVASHVGAPVVVIVRSS